MFTNYIIPHIIYKKYRKYIGSSIKKASLFAKEAFIFLNTSIYLTK